MHSVWCRAERRASAGRPGIHAPWLTRSPPTAGARGATALLPASTHRRPPTTRPRRGRHGSPRHPCSAGARARSGPVAAVPRAGDPNIVLLPQVKGLNDFLIESRRSVPGTQGLAPAQRLAHPVAAGRIARLQLPETANSVSQPSAGLFDRRHQTLQGAAGAEVVGQHQAQTRHVVMPGAQSRMLVSVDHSYS